MKDFLKCAGVWFVLAAIGSLPYLLLGPPVSAQAPLNPALTGPQFGNAPALGPNTPLGVHPVVSPVLPLQAPPVGTNCTVVAGSTDTAGQCAATATSGVAIAFATSWNSAPFCIVKDRTTASGDLLTAFSKTGFTMGTTVSADVITWVCLGQPGG